MLLNELTIKEVPYSDTFDGLDNNKKLLSYRDAKGNVHTLSNISYDMANDKTWFEFILKKFNPPGWWAYTHQKIGFYASFKIGMDNPPVSGTISDATYKARARYLFKESYYDEDNFFILKLPQLEKPIICQLRISDHMVMPSTYYQSHSDNKPQCDACLNIIIGNDKSKFAPKPPIC